MGNFAARPWNRADRRPAAALLAAATLATIVAACATPKPTGPLLLHPVPPTAEGYSLVQGATVFSRPDFTVAARPWDYRLVTGEFRSSGEPNPFGDTDEAVGRFLFFKVRLENRSARMLVFNPMRASVLREDESPLVPLENSDLFAFVEDGIADAEARGRVFRRVSFDSTATVRPGQELERYLVFRAPEETATQFTLTLEDIWLDSKSFDLMFTFEAFPGK